MRGKAVAVESRHSLPARSAETPSYVVGIGGSAGSLKPLEVVLRGLSPCSAISVVVVTHRNPSAHGMTAILARATRLAVRDATDGMLLERGVVYVVPADASLALQGGRVVLTARRRDARTRRPIDELFQTIAEDCEERGAGVLLSGMGEDGVFGLARIKERFGICAVQAPSSAEYDSMPSAALAAGLGDIVGPPEEIGERIAALVRGQSHASVAVSAPESGRAFDEVLALVQARTGHDFRQYKKSTIVRRIERRMGLRGVRTAASYVTLVERDSAEVGRLLADLLIGVTSFFRDPEAFVALGNAIARRLRDHPTKKPFRAWVAGCASGEEAYSLAMIIRERWDEVHGDEHSSKSPKLDVQIYATDLDAAAIERARKGVYSPSIATQVSAERLTRFFDPDAGSFRVKKTLREMVVFAKHNLISDAPFTRLDVLTCRNVLIYMDLDLQRRLLPIFAYALAPRGILALGASETVTGIDGSFAPVDGAAHKLFERRGGAPLTADLEPPPDLPPKVAPSKATAAPKKSVLPESVTRAIVAHVTPPVIVIDARGELLYASQRMGKYLEQPVGRSSVNVFAMARDGLATPLRSAVAKALARRTKVVEHSVRLRRHGHADALDIMVFPLAEDFAGSALVAFVEREAAGSGKRADGGKISASTLAELRRTKAQLESVTREMSESHNLLRGMNEDLQSTNEELQSANEELTTSKEEMQSMNEELLSLNAELQSTNERLVTTNDDMRNLLNSSQIPTLFLDNELRLKRFTAPASRIARLIPSDLGRPITDLTWNITYATLAQDVAEVIRTLVFKEAEVVAPDGSAFTMRIHPYRTVDDVIDGVVMTFIDITAQKQAVARETLAACGRLMASIATTWPGIAYVEDVASGRVDVVSAESERLLGYPHSVLIGATGRFWRTLRRPIRGRPGQVELQQRDGTRTAYRERVTIVATDAAGSPTSVMHTFRRLRKQARA